MVDHSLPCGVVEGIPDKQPEFLGVGLTLFGCFLREDLEPEGKTRREGSADILKRFDLILLPPLQRKFAGQFPQKVVLRNRARGDHGTHHRLLGKRSAGERFLHGLLIVTVGFYGRGKK